MNQRVNIRMIIETPDLKTRGLMVGVTSEVVALSEVGVPDQSVESAIKDAAEKLMIHYRTYTALQEAEEATR